MHDWLQRIETEPLLGVLAVTTALLVGLSLVTLAWLMGRSLWAARVRRRYMRFWDHLGQGLVAAMHDRQAEADWVAVARAYPVDVVRHCLNEYLVRTAGDYRDGLARIYSELGLLERDLAEIDSLRWGVKMRALRRAATMVTAEHRPHIVKLARQGGEIRLLVAQILGRIGTAEDVLGLLQSWQVTSRLSEYPVHVMVEAMSPEALRALLPHWDELGHSVAVQRILLTAAAHSVPAACFDLLPRASGHASLEVRIAAARACGAIARAETLALLVHLAADDVWEVRAAAVKALGAHRGPSSAALLVRTMSDKSFWVRQNAAAALRLHGADGISQLRQVRERSSDAYARDAADHVLTDLTIGLETA